MGGQYVTRTSPAKKKIAQDRDGLTDGPLPYRFEDAQEKPNLYRDEVRGIVPGYSGHVPRAQHAYSGTHYGPMELIKDPSPQKKLVAQARHPSTKEPVVLGDPYREMVDGIIPGYAGHVPKSAFTYGVSHQGGCQPFTGDSPTKQKRGDDFLARLIVAERSDMVFEDQDEHIKEGQWWPKKAPTEQRAESYRDQVSGIVPGYAGHVPGGKYKTGMTKVGKMPRGQTFTDPAELGMTGIPNTKDGMCLIIPALGSNEVEHERIDHGPVLPGYSGYVPGAHRKVGASTYWTESGKRFGDRQAGESTEDNDRQEARSQMTDTFGSVGK